MEETNTDQGRIDCAAHKLRRTIVLACLIMIYGCGSEHSVAIQPVDKGQFQIRLESFGEYRLKYLQNQYGDTVKARAQSCYAKLNFGVNQLFVEQQSDSLPAQNAIRSVAVMTTSTFGNNLDIRRIDLSENSATWTRRTNEEIIESMIDGSLENGVILEPAMRGNVETSDVAPLLVPTSQISQSPLLLEHPISHQTCFFVRVWDRSNTTSVLILSDMNRLDESSGLSFSDILETVLRITEPGSS